MALPARITGPQYNITANTGTLTSITKWQTVKTSFAKAEEDATAADSTLTEAVFTTKQVTITVTGFLGTVNNGATLPMPGDSLTGFAVAVGADNVLPSLTDYTNIKVQSVDYDKAKGPGTFSFTAQSGKLN